jgi:hypothetical protein
MNENLHSLATTSLGVASPPSSVPSFAISILCPASEDFEVHLDSFRRGGSAVSACEGTSNPLNRESRATATHEDATPKKQEAVCNEKANRPQRRQYSQSTHCLFSSPERSPERAHPLRAYPWVHSWEGLGRRRRRIPIRLSRRLRSLRQARRRSRGTTTLRSAAPRRGRHNMERQE